MYNARLTYSKRTHSVLLTNSTFVKIGETNIYFILYSENQCISKLDKIGIFIDMKFH